MSTPLLRATSNQKINNTYLQNVFVHSFSLSVLNEIFRGRVQRTGKNHFENIHKLFHVV